MRRITAALFTNRLPFLFASSPDVSPGFALGVFVESQLPSSSSRTPHLLRALLLSPQFWARPMQFRPALRLRQVACAFLLLAALVVVHSHVGPDLVTQWLHDPNHSDGYFVPVLAAWMLWRSLPNLENLVPARSWWSDYHPWRRGSSDAGGSRGRELHLARLASNRNRWTARPLLRLALFPSRPLSLACALPDDSAPRNRSESHRASPAIPALWACHELHGFLRHPRLPGNITYLPSIALEVAEAFTGIRSLISMVALAVAYSYFLEQKSWRSAVLIFSTVPIAVVANALRVMATGVPGQYGGPDKAEGFFHLFAGLVIFAFSFLLLWILHSVLRRFGRGDRQESSI